MALTLDLYCLFCDAQSEIPIETEWGRNFDVVTAEDALCPKHIGVLAFVNEQCPGCVGGFGDAQECPLAAEYMPQGKSLSHDHMVVILSGRCPHRVGGTYELDRGKPDATLTPIDISEVASSEAGKAMHDAIMDYCHKYGG